MNTLQSIAPLGGFSPACVSSYVFFSEYMRDYIKKISLGEILTKKKVRFSPETIRQYKNALEHFQSFESQYQFRAKVEEINHRLMSEFEKYLISKELTLNSVSLYISKIKAVGNILFMEDLAFRPVRFHTPKEITTKVYLSLSEIKQIKNCPSLTDSERKVFDIFLIQTFTGLRYSTLQQFLENPLAYIKEFNGNTYIDIISSKTNERSVIPLGKIVSEKLSEYNLNMPIFSERYVNMTLKTIAQKSGINNPIPQQITKAGVRQTEMIEKWKMITTHTARRTLVSLGKQNGLDDRSLMGITGHKSEKQLNEYNRTQELEQIIPILGHHFFNQEI